MSILARDVKFGLRSLARQPRITIPVVLILALGIGATTAIFSVANGILLRQVPFDEPERLAWLGERTRSMPTSPVSYLDYLGWVSTGRSAPDGFRSSVSCWSRACCWRSRVASPASAWRSRSCV